MNATVQPVEPLDLTEVIRRALASAFHFHEPAVLLSCEKSFRKLTVVNDFTLAQAFHSAWTCRPLKQNHVPRVAICHIKGVVRKVYRDLVWSPEALGTINSTGKVLSPQGAYISAFSDGLVDPNAPLWSFTANEAPEWKVMVGADLSPALTRQGMANPVRYVNCD